MGTRKRRSGKKSQSDARDRPQQPKATEPDWPLGKKVLFGAISTLGFFLLLEFTLFVLGVDPILYREDPYVGFASTVRVFTPRVDADGETYLTTAPNKIQWFNQQQFPEKKKAGTYRIFSLGGSTTYGRPYNDAASFSGWLREFLKVADPSYRWEVVNAGGISYASYRVANVMEELLSYDPDLFIIYSGHNEFLERRTYAGLLKTPRAVTALGEVASRTRIYAALGKLLTPVIGQQPVVDKTKPVLDADVNTILANSVGPSQYTRDDSLRRQVLAHYEFNLHRMLDMARSAGAQVVLVTPASNLKDCSPFKSEHSEGLTETEIERFEDLMKSALKGHRAGNLTEALAAVEQAEGIDERYADLYYRKGQLLYDLGRYQEARLAFMRALNEDICPLRATSEIRQIIYDVASERGIPLLDFAAVVEDKSEYRITGSSYFLDHVHLTVDGYGLLARELVDTLAEQGIVRISDSWNEPAIEAVSAKIANRLDAHAHGVALRNLARVFDWAGKLEEAERLAKQASEALGEDAASFNLLGRNAEARGDLDAAIQYYARAIEIQPNHADAHGNLGLALMSRGRVEEAIAHYRQALQLNPRDARTHSNLGIALMSRGSSAEAIGHYQEALRITPDYAEAHNNLGIALMAEGKSEEAIDQYRAALQILPRYAEAHSNLGIALLKQGRADQGIQHLRKALEIVPEDAEAASNLGIGLYSLGKTDQAISYYRQALGIDPGSAEAHYNLGIALASQHDHVSAIQHYRKVLAINPTHAQAHSNLAVSLMARNQVSEATRHLRRAVALMPDSPQPHHNLGTVLVASDQFREALESFRQAAELSERKWAPPLSRMAWILSTHQDPGLRDGEKAVELAEQAARLTGHRDPLILDVLAAAYAESKRFAEAVRITQQALELYSSDGASELAAPLGRRLELYRQSKPYRER